MSALEDLHDARMRFLKAQIKLIDVTRERDELIRAARVQGHPLRSIAGAAGVSHQTVANVVAAGAATTTSQHQPPS